MKTINEMTEIEILSLEDENVELLIKHRKAMDGIKIMYPPKKPELQVVEGKDKTIYKCSLFGQYLVFEDIEELHSVLSMVKSSLTACSISSNYSSDSDTVHIEPKLKNVSYDSNDWDRVETMKVYSNSLYAKVRIAIELNKKVESEYKSLLDEFKKSQEESEGIESEIWDKVMEIRDKYYNLNLHVQRFISEYFPLADKDEKVAMNFLKKAYVISTEDEAYILDNYKAKKK